jgi:hypothetical protein
MRLQGIRQNFLSSNAGVNLINSYVLVPETNFRVNLEKQSDVISAYSLLQNYPNPFNPVTQISYTIPKDGFVVVKVFDVLGREVVTLINEEKPAGVYTVSFDASSLASGIYFYTITAGSFNQTRKMILVK